MTPQTQHAAAYANQLLANLAEPIRVDELDDHPAITWKRSGQLHTTGLMLPLPLASHADGALMALRAISPNPEKLPNSGALLMGERARLRKTKRIGRFCAGGYGQLMDTLDGRIALNLVRDDDWTLIPAWLEDNITDWDGIESAVRDKPTQYLTERAAEIGLAVAEDKLPIRPETWFSKTVYKRAALRSIPLIVDLSGLWAGPLASSLLQITGAKVIKVEGPDRPDGMRQGHAGFYALLNAGKDCVALDFRNESDLNQLKRLIDKADIVIEASRPRSLPQLGIRAEEFMVQKPGKIWARLTAYGQAENRIGFGDDIGISAGLTTIMDQVYNEPSFVGDAIADPVSGIHLALAIQAFRNQGGGVIIDFAMVDVLRYAMGEISDDLSNIAHNWQQIADDDLSQLYPLRKHKGCVKPLGEYTNFLAAL